MLPHNNVLKKNSQLHSRNATAVTRLWRFFRRIRCCRISSSMNGLKNLSRSTARGISKHGDPRSPTFSRTGPSIGIMTLVPSRQFAPVRPSGG